MKEEQKMWKELSTIMGNSWDATRHEDSINIGIPDISFGMNKRNGWIELKTIKNWPKKDTSPVKLRYFTAEQKRFIKARGARGGNCWFILKIVEIDTWYLFRHDVIDSDFGVSLDKFNLELRSNISWKKGENIKAKLVQFFAKG